jgi:paraquat-inducible protein B
MTHQHTPSHDHGVIAPKRGLSISWVWLFPILACIAAATMFYRNWISEGPTVYVQFATAPGIKPEKTLLYYRGVEAGTVTGLELGKNLDTVLLKVRLRKYAEDLAREGTLFWIDQPVFNLAKPSGIESLIEGNSLQARKGSGSPAYFFVGSDEVPLAPLEGQPLEIRLTASAIPLVETGAEILFRGLPVGLVRKKGLDEKGVPYLELGFDKKYVDLVRTTSRFWVIPPVAAKIGPGVLNVDVPSIKNFLLGSIAMDNFDDPGTPVQSNSSLTLSENERSARATSEPLTLEFKDGQGITEGMTELRYLGIPVGVVGKVNPTGNKVVVTARLLPGYDMLRRKGSVFSVVRPSIALPKVSGLETLVSGVYIDCIPGQKGTEASRFQGVSQEDAALVDFQDQGFDVILTAPSSKIGVGTPVIYRGLIVGKITRKDLTSGGGGVQLTASVKDRYAVLLRENSRFWNAGGVKISGGLISLNVQSSVLESKGLGGVEFSTPTGASAGAPVKEGHRYDLYDEPRKEWLNWIPSIPLPGGNN